MSGVADPLVGEEIKERGWRCGSVIPVEMYDSLRPHLIHPAQNEPIQIASDDWLIVISHSCDITAAKLTQEPFVEVLVCRPIFRRDRHFTNRKSTRRLHFRPNPEEFPSLSLDAHAIRDRYLIPREHFIRFSPCEHRRCGAIQVNGLQSWYALRYQRAAWPDSLNACLAPLRTEIEDALKGLNDDRSELRVGIVQESSSGRPIIRLAVFLIVEEETWKNDHAIREEYSRSFHRFLGILRTCDQIMIDEESEVLSGGDFSWQDQRMTEIWNLANLTPIE